MIETTHYWAARQIKKQELRRQKIIIETDFRFLKINIDLKERNQIRVPLVRSAGYETLIAKNLASSH